VKKFTFISLIAGMLFFSLSILATWLYSYSQVDYLTYQQQTKVIRDIQENTAALTRKVILVQQGQSYNYDKVAKTLNDNEVLVSILASEKKNKLSQIIESWNDLKVIVENIKSDHAVYQNSLKYFPIGTEHLHSELSTNKNNKALIKALLNLERQVILFSLGHRADTFEQLNSQIKAFNTLAEKLPKDTEFSVLMLSKHAQIILKKQQRLKHRNTQLLNTKIPQQIQHQLTQYNQNHQQQVNQAAKIRLILYIVCVALLLVITVAKLKILFLNDKVKTR